jgi:hypothetical protein
MCVLASQVDQVLELSAASVATLGHVAVGDISTVRRALFCEQK